MVGRQECSRRYVFGEEKLGVDLCFSYFTGLIFVVFLETRNQKLEKDVISIKKLANVIMSSSSNFPNI